MTSISLAGMRVQTQMTHEKLKSQGGGGDVKEIAYQVYLGHGMNTRTSQVQPVPPADVFPGAGLTTAGLELDMRSPDSTAQGRVA